MNTMNTKQFSRIHFSLRKMNTKGFELLLKKVMGLVITAIVIILLFILISKTYALIQDKNQELKIKTQMEKIVINAKKIHEQGGETRIEIFSPVNWYLRTFPDYDFPLGACKQAVGCVCICKELDCSSTKQCEPFDFDVQLVSSVSIKIYSPDSVEDKRRGGIVELPDETYKGALKFSEALYEIKIIKEEKEGQESVIKLIKVGGLKLYGKMTMKKKGMIDNLLEWILVIIFFLLILIGLYFLITRGAGTLK